MSVGKYGVCPQGAYKVALVLDPTHDYHWYRQNSDGTWSHKIGGNQVNRIDAFQNMIFDPESADRNYSNTTGSNYTIFIGYYYIYPLNNIIATSQQQSSSAVQDTDNDNSAMLNNLETTIARSANVLRFQDAPAFPSFE